ncbi:MAG: hypothetical protein Q9163_006409 [Psora crenata]
MRFLITASVAVGFLTLALAHPVAEKRANSLPPVVSETDVSVLQLALYQEYLELALYTGGFENFTDEQYRAEGFPPGFRDNVGVIAQHEAIHAQTISAILTKAGYSPISPCTYHFPYNSPSSFVNLANMLTSVGIGAYLGGAALLTDSPALVTAASSIVTVEARHDTYLRTGIGAAPFPMPFDTALTAVFAFNLARLFVVQCPQQLPLPVLPRLTVEEPSPPPNLQKPAPPGTQLTFRYDPSEFFVNVDPNAALYIGFINLVTNVTYTQVTNCGTGCASIPVPEGATGVGYAVLTTFDGNAALTEDQLSQFGTLAGPAEVVVS